MQSLIWIQLSLNLLLASFAFWMATTARSRLKELRTLLASRSMRSLAQLDAELTELSSAFSSLATTQRRLSSRIGMQDVRGRQREASLPANFETLSPAERKQVLRKKLADGSLRAISDNGEVKE